MIKSYFEFLNESANITEWIDMKFESHNGKEVADIIEDTLLSKSLRVIDKGASEFVKLEQIADTSEGEKILEITGNELILFTTPFEFIRWNQTAEGNEILDPCYIVKTEDYSKI